LSCTLPGTLLNERIQIFQKRYFVRVVWVSCLCLLSNFPNETRKSPERGILCIPIRRHLVISESKALICTITVSVDTSTFSSEDRNSSAFRKAGLLFRHKIMASRYSSVGLRTTFRVKRSSDLGSIPGNIRVYPCPSPKPTENSRNPNGCSVGFEYP
jgi:hypothetical protein